MSLKKAKMEARAAAHSELVKTLATEQTAETREKVTKMLADIEAMSADIANIERADKMAAEFASTVPVAGAPEVRNENKAAEYRKAYSEWLQRGDVNLGFIGGAEVDRFGNINTTVIGARERPVVKLPGSGGGADIACLAQRLVSLMEHEPRRLRARVDFITSPGYGDGSPDWRARQGLVRGGPSAVITTLGVLRFDSRSGEAYLASYHPFTTPHEVQAATGWPLRLAEDCAPTPAPAADELRLIREADPHGFWTR